MKVISSVLQTQSVSKEAGGYVPDCGMLAVNFGLCNRCVKKNTNIGLLVNCWVLLLKCLSAWSWKLDD